jgi:outer membrane protein assembly factor BamA
LYDTGRRIHRSAAIHVFTSEVVTDTICAVMVRKLLLPILLLSTLSCFAASDFRIVAIRATGSKEFSEEEIARASGLTINQTIAAAEFKNAADRLAQTGAFAQVGYKYGPMGPGMFVEFQVEDAPEFLPVRFENFVWMSDDQLNTELKKRVALFHGHLPPGGGMVDATVEALQTMLTERGVQARAGMRLHTFAPGKPIDAVSLYVDGVPLIIKHLVVANANQVPASDVSEALKAIVGMNFDRGVIDETIHYRLEPVYRSRGLLHATIDPVQVAATGDLKNPDVDLTLSVHEGPQYKFGDFKWTGNTIVTEADLKKTIAKCTTGGVANLLALMDGAKVANGAYTSRGYLESKVQLMPNYDDEKKIVDYELHVVEGRQFHMGAIKVVGLEADQCEKMEKSWKIKAGDPYDPSYETIFIRENLRSLHGRPAKTIVTQNKDATVDVRVEF